MLAQSTPANIRRECINVYKERFQRKDEPALRAFFGPAEQGKQFLQLIRDFETDRFRPLDNYLKEKNEKTDDKNVELLAWLIDFEHRPYGFDKNFLLTDNEIAFIRNSEERKTESGKEFAPPKIEQEKREAAMESEPAEESLAVEVKAAKKNGPETIVLPGAKADTKKVVFKKAGVIILTFLISFIGIYIIGFADKTGGLALGNPNTGCMYWVNDHYEPVPCNKEKAGELILPLNEEKMKNFKKITREDTITERSIGVIYYLKTGNKPEYFTMGGNHPIYITRNLKVLSRHIYEKHLLKKDSAYEGSAIVKH